MTRRSILLLSPSSGFGGGIERVVDAVQFALGARAHRLDLYLAGRDPRAAGDRLAKLRFAGRAARAARDLRPSAIVCLHAGLLPVAIAIGAIARAPVSLVAHGTEVWSPMGRRRRALVRACRHHVAVSQFTASWLAERAGLPSTSIDVLSLPVAPSVAEQTEHASLDHLREPVALTVSRLDPGHRYKGHFAVAEAWPVVLQTRPDARWVVIGDGDDLPALRERCGELGLADTVRFTGRVADLDLAGWYRRASALVLPSVADVESQPPTGEGFGLVYAEAGAFGVPSIASTSGGGALDYVKHMETGLAVAPGDTPALARAILQLLDEPDLRVRLGEAARKLTHERHHHEVFSQRLAAILGE